MSSPIKESSALSVIKANELLSALLKNPVASEEAVERVSHIIAQTVKAAKEAPDAHSRIAKKEVLDLSLKVFDTQEKMVNPSLRMPFIPETNKTLLITLQQMCDEVAISDDLTVLDLWFHFSMKRIKDMLSLIEIDETTKQIKPIFIDQISRIYNRAFLYVYITEGGFRDCFEKAWGSCPIDKSFCPDKEIMKETLLKMQNSLKEHVMFLKSHFISTIEKCSGKEAEKLTKYTEAKEKLAQLHKELFSAHLVLSYITNNEYAADVLLPIAAWPQLRYIKKDKLSIRKGAHEILCNLHEFKKEAENVKSEDPFKSIFSDLLHILSKKEYGKDNELVIKFDKICEKEFFHLYRSKKTLYPALHEAATSEDPIEDILAKHRINFGSLKYAKRATYLNKLWITLANNFLSMQVITDIATVNNVFGNFPCKENKRIVCFTNNLKQIDFLLSLIEGEYKAVSSLVMVKLGKDTLFAEERYASDPLFQECLKRNGIETEFASVMHQISYLFYKDAYQFFQDSKEIFSLLKKSKEYSTFLLMKYLRNEVSNKIGAVKERVIPHLLQLTEQMKKKLQLSLIGNSKPAQAIDDGKLIKDAVEFLNKKYQKIFVALQMLEPILQGAIMDRWCPEEGKPIRLLSTLDFADILSFDFIELDIWKVDWTGIIPENPQDTLLEEEELTSEIDLLQSIIKYDEEAESEIEFEESSLSESEVSLAAAIHSPVKVLSKKEKRAIKKAENESRLEELLSKKAKAASLKAEEKSFSLEVRNGMKRRVLLAQIAKLGIHHSRTTGGHAIYQGGIVVPNHGLKTIKAGTLKSIQTQVEKALSNAGAGK